MAGRRCTGAAGWRWPSTSGTTCWAWATGSSPPPGASVPAATTAAILAQMSRAHVLLAQGQGAELAWRQDRQLGPPPAEALKVYALKTAPAFEAALAVGMLLGQAGPEEFARLRTFARHVGVGFQVLNDLEDWADDCQAARPTYLTALALAAVPPAQRDELADEIRACRRSPEALEALRGRFAELGVFTQADELIRRLRQRAQALAGQFQPRRLGELCDVLVECILRL